MGSDFSAIRKWYSGKALAVIDSYVLPTLAQAEEQGYWPKGASRKVCAALNKQTVAAKWARTQKRGYNERRYGNCPNATDPCRDCTSDTCTCTCHEIPSGLLDDVMDNRKEWYKAKLKGSELTHAMYYGVFKTAKLVWLAKQLLPLVCGPQGNSDEGEAVMIASRWAADFAPVGELVDLLDSRRPPRVVVMGTLSRLVVGNLCGGLNLDISTVRCPPEKREWVKRVVKGKEVEVLKITILWPAGTRFGRGRFTSHHHCQACGHAIKNLFNWVPVLIDDASGVPHGFWMGMDCAGQLFGADVEGEAEYTNRDEGATVAQVEVRS